MGFYVAMWFPHTDVHRNFYSSWDEMFLFFVTRQDPLSMTKVVFIPFISRLNHSYWEQNVV